MGWERWRPQRGTYPPHVCHDMQYTKHRVLDACCKWGMSIATHKGCIILCP